MGSHRNCKVPNGLTNSKTSLISAFNGCLKIGGAHFCCCNIRFWTELIATETCGERNTDRYVGKLVRESSRKRRIERAEQIH